MIRLVASSDGRWKQLFEKADIVSEGAARGSDGERTYFGSSDIVLLVCPETPELSMDGLARAMTVDPHVRLRALRTARREAQQRAGGPMGCLRAEITVSACARGVAVHVEVEARVFPERRVKPRTVAPESLAAGIEHQGGLPLDDS